MYQRTPVAPVFSVTINDDEYELNSLWHGRSIIAALGSRVEVRKSDEESILFLTAYKVFVDGNLVGQIESHKSTSYMSIRGRAGQPKGWTYDAANLHEVEITTAQGQKKIITDRSRSTHSLRKRTRTDAVTAHIFDELRIGNLKVAAMN